MQKVRYGVPVNWQDDQRLAGVEGALEGCRQDLSINGLSKPELAAVIHNGIVSHASDPFLSDYTDRRAAGTLTSKCAIAAIVSAMDSLESARDTLYPHLV